MNKTAGAIKINVWINDERLAALEQAGMAQLAEEAFASMKLLAISTTEEQKDLILQRYGSAKYDSATTRSIELLPKQAKDKLLNLSITMRSTGSDVTGRFLEEA
ncbi:DUF6955 family protein [Mycobacterium marinum]|uniref:DUF6955 family protein n=1 Tax=Mycobacterium marinum TaxID=1781 RepID=UPI000E3D49C8|nr:hypothetical protein [Mycobacterium marinum]RFZ38853.1 hypothetical protein KST_02676 [Mycobacterium marinum]GJO08090.1 hypothetical protein NJB1808e29_39970 [Mycobacterium marinum]GJP04533.1 hypothetical protein NJB18001_26420 [Mycobacterium marinum]GJP21838.1 hypothetical protein NJB1808_18860 [Mycobacterium marinum]